MVPVATAEIPRGLTSRTPFELLAWAGGARPFAQKLATLDGAVFEHIAPAAQGFVAALAAREHRGRTWVLVPDLRTQENLFNDLVTWHGAPTFFPQMEKPAFEEMLPDPELISERLAILHEWRESAGASGHPEVTPVIVVVGASLDEDVPRPQSLAERELRLAVGSEMRLEEFAAQVEKSGYERVSVVNERGQFAVRGGIVDVFSWQSSAPVRIEFFDLTIDSLRNFDVNSQTSVGLVNETVILMDRGGPQADFGPLRDYIATDDLVIAIDLPDNRDAQVHIIEGTRGEFAAAVASENEPGYVETEHPDTACHEHPLGSFGTGDFILQEARRNALREQLAQWRQAGWRVAMFFNNEGEIERFREIFPETAGLECLFGQLNHGFTVPAARLVILSDAELFGRYQHARARRLFNREKREFGRRSALDSKELEAGDIVVHHDYGIARYQGLARANGETGDDVLVLEFAARARLYVGLDQAHLVSRYVGPRKKLPELSKLGDERWSKTRKQAARSIFDYAARLLTVQAERETRPGLAHPADNKWQWEFENAFIYRETPDQLRAIRESKADMEAERPMDRLICGDVGFGKTEVAIRAAFKSVMGGRQVALLAPTTVLAEQHWRTLRERMSDYPIRVDLLSRWRTAKEQNETLRGLADGSVDIVVGTHRLLSKDVCYRELGLVVVDEEQRFGVQHKEKFKELFHLVDVLTLSATPIPRTLYLALMGARDMSTIETAPPNRVPVRTHICAYDERVMRDAIQREIERRGQVFFLHNRVADIGHMASKLRELCPGVRMDVGHGQMDEHELEEAMKRFVEGKSDVFVCTTIIESGIDIPNANTIIINRADRFGLADLYQLRGRVGRAGHQAYAYLMLPRDMLTTGDARKRVNAIKQYSTLGAGLKIAMRDLEIRGAGNLLGVQQSGHIVNIGFDLYCQLLKHSVARLKGISAGLRVEVAFRQDFLVTSQSEWASAQAQNAGSKSPAFIPTDYMNDPKLRIAAHKEIAELANMKELKGLLRAWRDRFGSPPLAVKNLLGIAELKLAAAVAGITAVEIRDNKLMLTRNGDFILIAGKFPRLPQGSGEQKLREATSLVKQL